MNHEDYIRKRDKILYNMTGWHAKELRTSAQAIDALVLEARLDELDKANARYIGKAEGIVEISSHDTKAYRDRRAMELRTVQGDKS